jgi:hypothetical protein
MRLLVLVIAVLAVMAGAAMAYQCPRLIGQLNAAVAPMDPNDPKVKQGKELIEEAQRLHEGASHAEAVVKAEEAAKVLGVRLDKV